MLFSEALMFFLLHQFFPLNPPNRMQIQNKNDNKFILDTLSYSPFYCCIAVSEKLNIFWA